jgi:hypothetical protein
MSRSGDCRSANNHQLVWMDMTRTNADSANQMATSDGNSAPVLAVSGIRHFVLPFSFAGRIAPKVVPNNMQPREG